MALVENTSEAEVRQGTAAGHSRVPLWTALGVVAAGLIIAIAVWATGTFGDSGAGDAQTAVPAGSVSVPGSERAILEQLVNRGYIPKEALEPAARPVDEHQATVDAVNRGLVPRQTLEDDAALADLVNRGLVPRQALDEQP